MVRPRQNYPHLQGTSDGTFAALTNLGSTGFAFLICGKFRLQFETNSALATHVGLASDAGRKECVAVF